MKARIKKTGEIVNIAEHATVELEMCDSYGDPICMAPEDIELIQEQTEDEHWRNLRERAAIAAMQGLLCSPGVKDIMPTFSLKVFAKWAVIQADVLIEELKRKKDEDKNSKQMGFTFND